MPRVAIVDERYESYNVEMAEVIGGNFWKPYNTSDATSAKPSASSGSAPFEIGSPDPSMFQARPPIELTNSRRANSPPRWVLPTCA
jgi:heparanase